jgi:peptide/nickel transport system ATP-binding protein
MAIPLLETRGLCKDFFSGGLRRTRTRVLDRVDLEIREGEIHGVVGESGSGKTTLVRCCLRLTEPSQGSVFFAGTDLTALSRSELRLKRREFQMVFQDGYASLNPGMTVSESILEPLQIHKVGSRVFQEDRVGELLEAVALNETLAQRYPGELSGGQQQRVGIARALALKPRLLIADEPVSALDVSVQAQILNLLADLKKRHGLTLVLISHSLYVLRYLCTRISVLYRGRIVETAPVSEFFQSPSHPYSRQLLNSLAR